MHYLKSKNMLIIPITSPLIGNNIVSCFEIMHVFLSLAVNFHPHLLYSFIVLIIINLITFILHIITLSVIFPCIFSYCTKCFCTYLWWFYSSCVLNFASRAHEGCCLFGVPKSCALSGHQQFVLVAWVFLYVNPQCDETWLYIYQIGSSLSLWVLLRKTPVLYCSLVKFEFSYPAFLTFLFKIYLCFSSYASGIVGFYKALTSFPPFNIKLIFSFHFDAI